MKILSYAWAIYDSRLSPFCKNCTGGGLVIRNICEYLGRSQESWLFIGQCRMPEMMLGNIRIVGTVQEKIPDGQHIEEMTVLFEKAIRRIRPDIVNFHGMGMLMNSCIQVCVRLNVPYVYTEHLYIGKHKAFEGYDKTVEWERAVYGRPKLKIIAVSSGMKKKILRDHPQIQERDIEIIVNGTDFVAERRESGVAAKYELEGKKVLLSVGTVVMRKNQLQIVRAFALLPEAVKNRLKIIFCGRDSMNGELQRQISDAGLQESLIYAGPIDSEGMKDYYSVADGLIMPSFAEGLSIAALESIAYGLPVLMFSDSECADDLRDEGVVCFAGERSDESLADAICRWDSTDWDRYYIVEYSKKYTMEKMAERYLAYYRKRLTID